MTEYKGKTDRPRTRYSIYLTFDASTEDSIERVRKSLTGVPSMAPHLTLLVFDDTDSTGVLEKFERLITGFEAFPLSLDRVNSFSAKRNVLYLEPLSSPLLESMYRRCLEIFATSAIVHRYRTMAYWHPHVTLAKHMSTSELHEAKAAVEAVWTPVRGHVCSIGLIHIQKPLKTLASKAFLSAECTPEEKTEK